MSPAVHLVSRKLAPGIIPAAPQGLVLDDAVLARSNMHGRSEETVFAEDAALACLLRRGMSFAEIPGPSGTHAATTVALLRRGLPKFFDLDVTALDVELKTGAAEPRHLGDRHKDPTSESAPFSTNVPAAESHQAKTIVALDLARRLGEAWGAGQRVHIRKLAKVNGDNAQVSFFQATQQWVLCSKKVALLASDRSDFSASQWAKHRYRFARSVAERWFDLLGNLEEAQQLHLREALSEKTLVGELVGGASHLIDYHRAYALQWFAVVPHRGSEPCWPPSQSQVFFTKCS